MLRLKYRFSGLWRREGGFTLVEVLATIIIMGILFAIASSFWFSVVESRQVDSAANQLASDLRLAHSSATNRLTEYRVAYVSGENINCAGRSATDPDPERRPDYCLLRQNDDGSWQQTPRYLPESTEIFGTGLNVDATIAALLGSADVRTIKFIASGSAESGGGLPVGTSNISITVSSDDGAPIRDIEVVPATSRVELD